MHFQVRFPSHQEDMLNLPHKRLKLQKLKKVLPKVSKVIQINKAIKGRFVKESTLLF